MLPKINGLRACSLFFGIFSSRDSGSAVKNFPRTRTSEPESLRQMVNLTEPSVQRLVIFNRYWIRSSPLLSSLSSSNHHYHHLSRGGGWGGGGNSYDGLYRETPPERGIFSRLRWWIPNWKTEHLQQLKGCKILNKACERGTIFCQ